MGRHSIDISSRQKRSWDLRTALWTDSKWFQEKYFDAVSKVKSAPELLPVSFFNKFRKAVQGLVIK